MECQNGQGVQNLARDENHGCPRLRRIEQGELMGVQECGSSNRTMGVQR